MKQRWCVDDASNAENVGREEGESADNEARGDAGDLSAINGAYAT